MKPVRAERLIYTRVETVFSPRRSSGFQTVWKSDTLTAAEVSAVEKCIQCFRPAPGIRRLQFFEIPSGKLVLSHTVQIAPHPEIVDRNVRNGAFLVHCFLLSREEMAHLDNDPFRFFDADLHLDGVERLVETLGRATGVAPPVEVVPVETAPGETCWPASEVVRLLGLVLRADDLRRQGRTVSVTGDSGQIEQTLRLAFRLVPVAKRLACTFITWAEGCPVERGLYWGAGATRRLSSDALEVDARERSVPAAGAVRRDDGELYWEWIENACFKTPLQEVLVQAGSVDLFVRAMEGSPLAADAPLRPKDLEDFLGEYRHAVADRICANFERQIRRKLARELAYHILSDVRDADFRANLEAIVPASSQIHHLARVAAHWLERAAFPDQDLFPELRDLARRGNHSLLLFWAATLDRKVDTKAREEALRKMTAQDFRRALGKLLHPIHPTHFVDTEHLSELLASDRLDKADEEILIDLVERILAVGGGPQLEPLVRCLYRIGEKGRHRLARMIRKQAVPERFRLEIAVAERPGLLGRLFS
jgi:hypothetical protein